jgi:tetratricopeptide (TPR) repeat protein/transcriptional regulator with XRE-family HTH domain
MGHEQPEGVIGYLLYAYLLYMPGAERDREQNVQLRLERERKGWSQKQVAAAIGTNAVMVSRWECGVMKPGPHFRQRLCTLYGRTPQELGFVPGPSPAAAPPPPIAEGPAVWCVPLRPNRYFTGRDAFLQRLHEALTTSSVPQAICGIAGMGKTQTALAYATRWRDSYPAVFWADATSRESLTAGFAAFAEAAELPVGPDEEPQAVVAAVMGWLRQNPGWLLILDNVDDLATVEPFLPPAGGSVLLTMQSQASGTVAESNQLDSMPVEDAVLFLLRRAKAVSPDGRAEDAPAGERDAAAAIVDAFDGLPLALDQAGAYVEETDCGLAGYLARYHTQQGELLSRRGVQALDHPSSLAATFALTLRQVEEADPTAADVLRLGAFLHPDGIPEELFGGDDQLAFDGALEVLRRYSLVRRHRKTRSLSVHRLVQAVVKGSLEHEERRAWAERAVAAIERVVPDIQTATWRGVQRYVQQALQGVLLIDEWELESAEAARILDQLGCYLRECAEYAQAEVLLRRGLAIRESLLGPDHPLTATSVANLARLTLDAGRYEEAVGLYRRALDVQERALGRAHPDTAGMLTGLASVYSQQGRLKEAEELFRRALDVQERTVGPDHPSTAYTLTMLSTLYRTQARWDEAEPLLRRALAIRERELGPDHPRVAIVLNNLAVVLSDRMRYDEAEACYRRALTLQEQSMGPDHADVAVTLHNLAGVHRDRGEMHVAESLYRRSLAIRERTLGPDHPTIAFHLASLAHVLQREGLLDEAHASATRALAIWRTTLGAGHANVARALSVLARVAEARHDTAEAAGLLRQALDVSRRTLGPAHSRTVQLEAEYARLTGGHQEAC